MAATIDYSYLIKNARHVETESGVTIVEPYLISGLTPGQTILSDAKRTPGIPAMHQVYPTEPAYVIQREPKPFLDSRTQAIVEVTYKTPSLTPGGGTSGVTWRFRGTLRDRITNFDYQGKKIVVNYNPTVAGGGSGGASTQTSQTGQVHATVAIGVLEMWKYYDVAPAAILPVLNKVNSVEFQGGGAFTWLCRDIQIESLGVGYKVAFVFEYDAETFVKTAAFRDIHGYVPSDVDDVPIPRTLAGGGRQNGWTNALVQGPISFAPLALPNVLT